MEIKHEIICDACNNSFSPKPEKVRDGEMEFMYYRCPSCGRIYLFSVTDAELRRHIAEYGTLARKATQRRLTKIEIRRAEKLLESNVERSRELRLAHSLEE